jgi:hypothetical protein
MKSLVLVGAVAAAAISVGCAAAHSQTAFCTGTQLTGKFAVVPNSEGAGNIVYRLTLRNRSSTACSVSGLPVARLLAKSGKQLPTHVIAAMRGAGTAALIKLAPGQAATATARFSPDVPGPGEPVSHTCEPTAAKLRVTARGGGATVVPIAPPTPVCEHGQLQFALYSHA